MINLISSSIDKDCGCLEAEMDTDAGFASLHLKPDGVAELFFDSGDCGEWEVKIGGCNKSNFLDKIQAYTDSLLISPA